MPRKKQPKSAVDGRTMTQEVLTAEELKEKWRCEAEGIPWVNPASVRQARAEEAEARARAEALAEAQRLEEERLAKKALEKPVPVADGTRYSPAEVRKRLDAAMQQRQFEPLVKLMELYDETYPLDYPIEALRGQRVCDTADRIKILTELAQYQLPKLKTVEVTGQVDHSISVTIRRFGEDAPRKEIEMCRSRPTLDIEAEVANA